MTFYTGIATLWLG